MAVVLQFVFRASFLNTVKRFIVHGSGMIFEVKCRRICGTRLPERAADNAAKGNVMSASARAAWESLQANQNSFRL